MAKKLLHKYSFNPATRTVTLEGIYGRERLLMISNVTTNQIIYIFNQALLGLQSYSINAAAETTTLVLDFNTTSMSASDELQIFIEADAQSFIPDETFTDPVSKFRVSTPANLIDTDFEYGLQSTKWETLEMVNNIPTFFSRNGDADLPVDNMNTIAGSSIVVVETTTPHGLTQGNPIIVVGSQKNTANGAFVVTSIIDEYTFQYISKATEPTTQSILDTYTQIFLGSVYQGTEFKLANLNGITTNAADPSTLTVSTEYPLGFKVGTSFFLTNSVGQKIVNFNAAQTTFNNFLNIGQSRTGVAVTGETNDWAIGAVYPYNWVPKASETKWFVGGTGANSTITVNTAQETITFNDGPHGFADGDLVVYLRGLGITNFGGLTDTTRYWVRTIDASTFYLTTAGATGTTRVNLTDSGMTNGAIRSCFVRAYLPTLVNTATTSENIRFDREIPFIGSNPNQAMIACGTVGSLPAMTNSDNLVTWTSASNQIVYPVNVSVTTGFTTSQFALSPNGSVINQAGTGVTGAVILLDPAPLANTIFFPNHQLQDNDVVFFNSSSASVPITRATYFRVTPVNNNRLRFRTFNTVSDFDITVLGDINATIEINGFTYLDGADVVTAPGHGLNNGDTVVYTNQGGSTIGALTNGLTYYVSQSTNDTLQLSTTASGLITPNLTINNATSGTAVDGYVQTNYQSIVKTAHGFTTGDRVQYTSTTPIGGLRNNGFYYIRVISANEFYVHRTANGAVTNDAADRIWFSQPLTGTSRLRKTSIVDLTSAGTGTQRLTANIDGASDGVYSVSNVLDDTTFQLASNSQIPDRTIQFDPASSVSIEENAVRIPDHYFRTGYEVDFTTVGTAPGGLTNSTTYYIIRVSRNWIRFATTLEDAMVANAIDLTSKGSGLCTLATPNIIGEVLGAGVVNIDAEAKLVNGVGTNFSSFFKTGDEVAFYHPEIYQEYNVTAINLGTYEFDTASNHGWATGDMVILTAEVAPVGTTSGFFYYVEAVDLNTVKLYPTRADALAATNIVVVSTAGTAVKLKKLVTIGSTTPNRVRAVLSPVKMQVDNPAIAAYTNLEYSVGTSLLVRADGFALHRPYDGGVELIPSTNPDSQMVRQTRKYFRYQSGKGIQVSFAINFSPTTQVERIVTTGTSNATVFTKFPHRMSVGLGITIYDAPLVGGVDYFNGVHTVTSIVDDYSFNITLASFPAVGISTGGFAEYYVNNWSNSHLRCGLFDDQNGMYFEYDGQQLSVCRRSSIKQISGFMSVSFGSGLVQGTNTKFLTQLSVGQYVVIRGQSYQITKISDDTTMYIAPSYRGATASGVIGTKTETEKVVQSNWNYDKCDGTGPSGYVLDIHKIQMAYMDYSWYGAGKVRFGFKDQHGNVKYVHSFIHNNKKTEAYLRSGNLPARYDIQNVGKPTYVPALAHWGTSVIMDGEFTDDKAYIFNASSGKITVTGNNTVTVTGRVAYRNDIYYGFDNNRLKPLNWALEINQSSAYSQIPENVIISGAGLQANTQVSVPRDNSFARTPYHPGINSTQGFQPSTLNIRNLLLLDRQPTTTAAVDSSYTVTISAGSVPVVYDIPLISIRLAPSVDTNTIGFLGDREIINRMQLLLQQVGILSTHGAEIYLRLNGSIDNIAWERVTNPSLSQLVFHNPGDSITGGTNIYSFRAAGSSGTTGRTQIATTENLETVATLGNSILGGDNTFPDGPDVLTVVARLSEDPSTVNTNNPFVISGRISWLESQA